MRPSPPHAVPTASVPTGESPELELVGAGPAPGNLSQGDNLVIAGGMLMVLASFLTWYFTAPPGMPGKDTNAWQGPGAVYSTGAVLLCGLLAGLLVGERYGMFRLPDLRHIKETIAEMVESLGLSIPALQDVTWGQVFFWASMGVALLVFAKFMAVTNTGATSDGYWGMGLGFNLACLASVLVFVGALRQKKVGARLGAASEAGQRRPSSVAPG